MTDAIAPAGFLAISDLQPAAGAPAGVLDEARRAIAVATLTGQHTALRTSPSAAAAPPPSHVAAHAAAAAELAELRPHAHLPQRVVRRDFATRLSPDPRVGAAPGAGQAATRTLGPFVDAFGRPAWIDIFAIPTRVAVQRAGSSHPSLYLELLHPGGTGSALTLHAGSIWIDASLFATGVPASSFVGLRIKHGTVNLGAVVALGASPIVVPAATTITLTLTLDPAAAPTGSGPGGDARAASVTTPAEVTLALSPAGVSLTSAGDATVSAFGTALALTRAAATAHYDPVFGRIDFPFTPDQPSLRVASSTSTLVRFAGTAAFFGAAWSLPITIADPASLGAAAGAGGIALGLLPGLSAQWTGRDAPADCKACVALVEPGLLAVGGFTARAAGAAQLLALGTTTFRLTNPAPFPFRFTSDATGHESWAYIPLLTATFDQPRTVNNERVRLAGPALVALLEDAARLLVFVEAVAPPASHSSVQSFCLKNLLLKASNPIAVIAAAVLSGTGAGTGAAALYTDLRFVVPILPDPYTTNLQFEPRQVIDTGVIGVMTVVLRWASDKPAALDIVLPAGALQGVQLARRTAVPPAQAEQGSEAVRADGSALREMEALFERAVGAERSGPTLLDLSTNVSQFGVTLAMAPRSDLVGIAAAPPPGSAGFAPSVADLFLQAPNIDVRVVTLPAVQWEPVVTPDQTTPFPSPLSYPTSGPPVVLGTNSVTLVPVAPRPAIDALLAAYDAGSHPVAARFTLPFGIVAVAQIHRSHIPIVPSPSLTEVQPTFSATGLKGGDQLRLRAARSLFAGPGVSPSLPGAAFQLHNARAGGAPTATTVLTPIDDTFNSNFGPGTTHARVPVTRIDISGYGESLFSDWRNPIDAAAIISKARFDVFVGRTAREIVQAYSVLYPYAIRVVRTITIERQNGAAIARHDSGWQPVSDGVYHYPKPALVTHPGVVRGAVAVGNIRDTGQRHTTPDGSELMAVRFDCALTIEGAVNGAGPHGVPARDQLGWVQLTDPPDNGQLAPAQYAALLDAVGPLGGLVDCTINIGGTGQHMRITHVSVAATPGPAGPEFAVAAWGSPILPGGGQWSFLLQRAGTTAPEAVDRDQGVPLVRAGSAVAPPPPTSPYRFADPSDLLRPDHPQVDYGLVHATGTQRLLFPRPKLETGAHALTSTQAPILADPYALATATGPFPRTAACIPFPSASYALAISAGGNLTLQPSPFTFTAPVLRRVLRDSATVRSIAYTADEHNTPSVVTIRIATADADPWAVHITNLSLASESGSLGEVSRVVGTIDSKASVETQLADSRFVFGPPLRPVADLVSFLEQFGNTPPPTVAMTNDWQLLAGIVFDFTKYALFLGPAVRAFVEKFIVDLDVKMQSKTSATSSAFVMQFELTIKIPTPFTPIVAIGLAKVQFQMSDEVTAWTFQLGCGIGVDFPVGIFKAIAYYAQSEFLITGDTVFGLGASSLVKATIDLEIVSVGVSIEAKIALLRVDCGPSMSSVWGVAQVTIAVEVSIFFVIDIEFDVQAQWSANLDGGPCELPDVL